MASRKQREKFCLYCGRPLPEKCGNRRRFCNDSCKMHAYRRRKAARLQALAIVNQ